MAFAFLLTLPENQHDFALLCHRNLLCHWDRDDERIISDFGLCDGRYERHAVHLRNLQLRLESSCGLVSWHLNRDLIQQAISRNCYLIWLLKRHQIIVGLLYANHGCRHRCFNHNVYPFLLGFLLFFLIWIF